MSSGWFPVGSVGWGLIIYPIGFWLGSDWFPVGFRLCSGLLPVGLCLGSGKALVGYQLAQFSSGWALIIYLIGFRMAYTLVLVRLQSCSSWDLVMFQFDSGLWWVLVEFW